MDGLTFAGKFRFLPRLLKKKIGIYFIVRVWVFRLPGCLHIMCMPGACRGHDSVLELLKLELWGRSELPGG